MCFVGEGCFFSAYVLETTDRAFDPVMGLKSVTVKKSNWYGFKPFENGYKGFSWETWTSCGIILQYPDGSEHEFTSDDFDTEIVNDFTITDDGKYFVRAIGRTQMLEALDLATEESVWGVYFLPPTHIHNVDEADDDDLADSAKWRELVIEGIGYVSCSFKWNGETYCVGVKGDKLYLLYWDGAEIKRSEEPFAKLGSRYNHCSGQELVDGNLVIYECAEPK